MIRQTVLGLVLLFSPTLFASEPHELIRRVVVFPLQVESTYAQVAEEIWWDLRAKLTEGKRFLVASRNFMEAKDVFQGRGALSSADAIILGRLLDAHAILTLSLTDRKLTLRAYEGRRGYELWERSLELHPSLPLSKQLPNASEKLLYDFLAGIPYQGFVVMDNLVGRPFYKEGEFWRVKAEVGLDSRITVGDPVQLMDLNVISLAPAFDQGGESKVWAEGKVVAVEGQLIEVELSRLTDPQKIREGVLVRFPSETKRLQETYSVGAANQAIEVGFIEGGRKLTPQEKERKPLVTALSFLANLAILLIVAL